MTHEFDPWARHVLRSDLIDDIVPKVFRSPPLTHALCGTVLSVTCGEQRLILVRNPGKLVRLTVHRT